MLKLWSKATKRIQKGAKFSLHVCWWGFTVNQNPKSIHDQLIAQNSISTLLNAKKCSICASFTRGKQACDARVPRWFEQPERDVVNWEAASVGHPKIRNTQPCISDLHWAGPNIGPRRDIVQSCSIFHININENNQNLLWPSVIILIHNLTTNMNQPNIWNKKPITCYSSWNQQWNKHVSSKYQTSGHQQFMRFHKRQNTLQKRALINEAFMSHCCLNQTLNLHISYTYVVYESHRHIYTIYRCTCCKHLRNIIPDGSTPVRWDLSG